MSKTSLKISIITPSFNQGPYLEETIRSIIDQEYPLLEYIIIDGGSSDDSVDIIKKYEKYISYWVSEPDKGQADAINKGFKLAGGDILAWQNADDRYLPGTFAYISNIFGEKDNVEYVFGGWNIINGCGQFVSSRSMKRYSLRKLRSGMSIPPQPAVFFRNRIITKIGGLDISKNHVMDYDLYVKSINAENIFISDKILGEFRIHSESKTIKDKKGQVAELRCTRKALLAERATIKDKVYWLISDARESMKDYLHNMFHIYSFRDILNRRR